MRHEITGVMVPLNIRRNASNNSARNSSKPANLHASSRVRKKLATKRPIFVLKCCNPENSWPQNVPFLFQNARHFAVPAARRTAPCSNSADFEFMVQSNRREKPKPESVALACLLLLLLFHKQPTAERESCLVCAFFA